MKRLHRLYLVLLLMAIAIALAGCGQQAEEEHADFAYVLNSTGEFARIVRYKGEGAEVTIPDTLSGKPVKEIGEYTFLSTPHVTSISIPASVTKIEDPSFYTLPNLETITVAEDCVGFTVQDGVLYHKKMGTIYCYPQGKKGDSFTLPDTVKTINGHAFYNSQLKEINMGGAVTKVLAGAFAESRNLASVNFSPKTSQLFEEAFMNCASLTNLQFPDSLTSIGAGCFEGCTSLTDVVLPEKVNTLESRAFAGCTALKTVAIGSAQIQRIADGTFEGDASLESVTFGTDIMGIADKAFKGCSSLTAVALTDKLAALGQEAFAGCTALTDVTLPLGVTQVGARAFEGTAWLDAKVGDFVIDGSGVLLCYRGSETEVAVPEGVTNVSYLNANVTKVTVPEGVLTLSAGAFENCAALTEISLPASLTSMGTACFRNCAALTVFTVPASLSAIGEYCFTGCSGMEEYKVDPANVTFSTDKGVLYDKIRKWLLWYPSNSAMTSYTMDYGSVQIGPGAVQGARNLESFDASAAEGIKKLRDYAFADCPKLATVKVTNSFAVLGAHVFENCTSLADYEINYTVTEIGEGCFKNCTALKELTLSDPIAKIGLDAFAGTTCTFKVTSGTIAEEYVRAFDLTLSQ